MIKKTILAVAIAACSFSTAPTLANGFNTADVVTQTIEQLPECLEYKVHGISIRVRFVGPIPIVFLTLDVSHYSPDFITQTHVELDDMPWEEINELFGKPYKMISGVIFKAPMTLLLPSALALPMSGGKYQYSEFGDHQAGQQYEATVMGNPVAFIMNFIDYSGYQSPSMGKSKSAFSAGEYLAKWKDGAIKSVTNAFLVATGIDKVLEMLDTIKTIQNIANIVQDIQNITVGFGVSLGSSPFCPTPALPAMPYYLSGIDSLLWRIGYPVADIEHSLTVLNPLSMDRVGGMIPDQLTGIPLPELWGNIYPRWGTVNHVHDTKASAVIASRGVSVIGDNPMGLGRVYNPPGINTENVVWAKIYPEKTSCHKNIANTGLRREDQKRYAWNTWARHRCDLDARGKRIGYIPLGDIQVTPSVPE